VRTTGNESSVLLLASITVSYTKIIPGQYNYIYAMLLMMGYIPLLFSVYCIWCMHIYMHGEKVII